MDIQRYEAEELSAAVTVVMISGSLRVPWWAKVQSANPHTSGPWFFNSTIICSALPFSQAGFQSAPWEYPIPPPTLPAQEARSWCKPPLGESQGRSNQGSPIPSRVATLKYSPLFFHRKKKKKCIYTCSLRAFPIPLDVFLHRFFCPQKGIPNEKPWLLWYPRCQQLVTVWHHWANI